jgi:hypothetical protein
MKNLTLALFLFMASAACSPDEEPKPLVAEDVQEPLKDVDRPSGTIATIMGTFTSFAHGLSGKVVIDTDSSNNRTLRLENFTMNQGPDVYVFLSKSNNYSAANTIPLALLKEGYSNSNLTLSVDETVDLNEHKFVLVYCVQFSSLFGYAEPM